MKFGDPRPEFYGGPVALQLKEEKKLQSLTVDRVLSFGGNRNVSGKVRNKTIKALEIDEKRN